MQLFYNISTSKKVTQYNKNYSAYTLRRIKKTIDTYVKTSTIDDVRTFNPRNLPKPAMASEISPSIVTFTNAAPNMRPLQLSQMIATPQPTQP